MRSNATLGLRYATQDCVQLPKISGKEAIAIARFCLYLFYLQPNADEQINVR